MIVKARGTKREKVHFFELYVRIQKSKRNLLVALHVRRLNGGASFH